jgi:hypothetical protein
MTLLEQALELYKRTAEEKKPANIATRALETYIIQAYGKEGLLGVQSLKGNRQNTITPAAPKQMAEYKMEKPVVSQAARPAKPMKEFNPKAQNSTLVQANALKEQPKPRKEPSSPVESVGAAGSDPVRGETAKAMIKELDADLKKQIAGSSAADVTAMLSADEIKGMLNENKVEYPDTASHRQLANRLIKHAQGE